MNDLSTSIITPSYSISLNESLKQSQTFDFEDGTTQTIGKKSVPSIIIDIQYQNISQAQYDALEVAYQNNHSNTFLVDFGDKLDIRILYDRLNNGVFAFGDYSFSTSVSQINNSEIRYSGKVTLITSVIFNYSQFQDIFNEPSTYIANTTDNTDFLSVLDIISPNKVTYGYQLNKRFSNVGQSLQSQRDLGNNKKTWELEFFCVESDWMELITFFRKKGGIGTFGMPKEGFFTNSQRINARFQNDDFSHQKLINNVYTVKFKIIEVR